MIPDSAIRFGAQTDGRIRGERTMARRWKKSDLCYRPSARARNFTAAVTSPRLADMNRNGFDAASL